MKELTITPTYNDVPVLPPHRVRGVLGSDSIIYESSWWSASRFAVNGILVESGDWQRRKDVEPTGKQCNVTLTYTLSLDLPTRDFERKL